MRYFDRILRRLAALCVTGALVSACGGGGGGGRAVPAPTPTQVATAQPTVAPSPTSSPVSNPEAYTCPASDAVAAGTRVAAAEGPRRMLPRVAGSPAPASATAAQLIAVSYDARSSGAQRSVLAARETRLGATLEREYAFARTNVVTRVLSVAAGSVARVEAALRGSPGVRAVGPTGTRRYPTSVTAPYFPNDPYFTGFSLTAVPAGGGTPPPQTFEIPPLEESATVPGQWDMHATRLEYAFAYSQANNGSGVTNPSALGSSSVKLAVIDTGEDATHPELAAKIVYQRCFITNPSNVQSRSNFSTDEDGHGTDVAGIAGAASGNGFGFTAAGGNVELYAYRVFPTPDDNCTQTDSKDNQCGTSTLDIASAIDDAVANHVNVISLSLGGTPCVGGQDADATEGNAIAEAIAANIIVVAAAGNSTGPPVESPACDPGVIAVGATAIADGTPNGSKHAGGLPGAPLEYVASYSDYGSPAAAVGNPAAWGIVAPGGDPAGDSDTDDLHWIENLWTSTPFEATASDKSFVGNCAGDYPSESGPADCRILIAGTSMATPHVAGAAALILAVNSTYQNPSAMKQLLCSTAVDISDPSEGCGRLDVYRAMAVALHDINVPTASTTP